MRFRHRLFLLLGLASSVFAVPSSKSGIDINLSGTQGVDWDQEYFFHDTLVSDRSVIYVKQATTISFSHNAHNVSWQIGVDGNWHQLPVTVGNEGVIRWKVDRDLQYGRRWGDASGSSTWYTFTGGTISSAFVDNPVYSSPFTLASLTYDGSTPVVGTTGATGGAITDWGSYYWRGIADSVGDEWHVLTVADDDSAQAAHVELRTGDGKVFLVVVNPKTPVIKVAATGDAQFYTTPPKVYFIPKIHPQTTYFNAGTGAVSFTIKDINGNNVFWRVNGGSFTDAGSSTKVLTAADFSTGTNTLDYYYAGNAAYTKTRIVVKNPGYPSASESHGMLLFGEQARLDATKIRITREPYQSQFYYLWRDGLQWVTAWDAKYRSGGRNDEYARFAIRNAVSAALRGWTSTPDGVATTSAQYAKQQLMDTERNLDPVGFEINHSNTYIPTRELFYRGYYDMNATFSIAFAYDLLIANYKSTQHAGGITAIEDYFIRDLLAAGAFEAMLQEGNFTGQEYTNTGMWGTARNVGGLFTALAMPAYSTPYYGTSGFDGNTTVYPWTPFPDTPLTWKKVFFENNAALVGYPNLNYRFGVEEYEWPGASEAYVASFPGWPNSLGDYHGKIGYLGSWMMGHIYWMLSSVTKANNLGLSLPHLEAGFAKMAAGTIVGMQEPAVGYDRAFASIGIANSLHPSLAPTFIAHAKANDLAFPGTYEAEGYEVYINSPYSLIYYENDFSAATATPRRTKPAGARMLRH